MGARPFTIRKERGQKERFQKWLYNCRQKGKDQAVRINYGFWCRFVSDHPGTARRS